MSTKPPDLVSCSASDSVGVAEDASISLIEPVDSMSVNCYQNQRGFGFRLDLRSFAGVISYRQRLAARPAMLLTANSWGRCLFGNLTLGQGYAHRSVLPGPHRQPRRSKLQLPLDVFGFRSGP